MDRTGPRLATVCFSNRTCTTSSWGTASTATMAQAAPDHQPRPLLRIGLVPEHFSAPLQLAAADGTFAEHGVDVELVTCPGGTGEVRAARASRQRGR